MENQQACGFARHILDGFWEEDRAIESAREALRRAKIQEMPRVKFFCGRNVYTEFFRIGAIWGKNLDAGEGELVYQHEIMFHCRMWVTWHV